MRCRACGFANLEAARFCAACGELLGGCPACGASFARDAAFCSRCGAHLAEAAPPAPSPLTGFTWPRAERRRVSVLFGDVENFTSLAESLDPEEVRALLSRYFEVARAVVSRYGGTLEKFIGDAVMAVWGAPISHEDDPERAVRAALEFVAAVGEMGGPGAGRGLAARAAVTSGEAAVTPGARGEGLVAGDLVNTAARLQTVAAAGGVLVDDATRRAVGDALAFQPAGEHRLRGKSRSVVSWRPDPSASSAGAHRTTAHAGPFVGREAEMRELESLFDATRDGRRGRLVSVTGIAGIGKSRLAWELEKRIEARGDEVAWHVGRAPSYGQGIAFAPVAEMVRQRIGALEGEDVEVARRRLATALDELVRDDEERRWLEGRLVVLLAPGRESVFDRDDLFAAWRRFFERIAERTPTVLIFEDLQWADSSLLDFIEHLSRWALTKPILTVALARPELLDHRPGWGAGQRSFTGITLERLSDGEIRELLMGLAPALAPGTAKLVLERAGGVPLYAVEMVRMLAEQRPGDPHADARGDRVPVIDPLRALIDARIDALQASDRSLLLAGAVLGRRFHPGALAAVAGADLVALRPHVESLIRRGLLALDDERGSPARGQLVFMQDLVREVAYDTLSHGDRRELHLAAARYLVTRQDEELTEAIAAHLVAAHALDRHAADAGSVAERARTSLSHAARRAIAVHAPERALELLQRALELTDRPELRGELLEAAASAARSAARFRLAETYLDELVALREAEGDAPGATRARVQLASLLLMVQRNDTARGQLQTALRALQDLATDAGAVEAAAQLARAHMVVGEDDEAISWADRVMRAADALELSAVSADARVTRGTARFRLGRPREGLTDLRAAIDEGRRLGLPGLELRARNNLAWVTAWDDPHATLAEARGGMEVAERVGLGDMKLQLTDVACMAAVDTGDWDWAVATLAKDGDDELSPAHQIVFTVTRALLEAFRDGDASALLSSLEPLQPDTDPQLVAWIDFARAWLAFLQGAWSDASRLAHAAAEREFGTERVAMLALATRADLWRGDLRSARHSLGLLRRSAAWGRMLSATVSTLSAGIAAHRDRAAARDRYAEGLRQWEELNAPLHHALAAIEEDRFAGPVPAARRRARGLLHPLGASAVEALLGRER